MRAETVKIVFLLTSNKLPSDDVKTKTKNLFLYAFEFSYRPTGCLNQKLVKPISFRTYRNTGITDNWLEQAWIAFVATPLFERSIKRKTVHLRNHIRFITWSVYFIVYTNHRSHKIQIQPTMKVTISDCWRNKFLINWNFPLTQCIAIVIFAILAVANAGVVLTNAPSLRHTYVVPDTHYRTYATHYEYPVYRHVVHEPVHYETTYAVEKEPATYTAQTKGSLHVAPLPGHEKSQTSLNL
jgi:Cuticle protein